MKCIYDKTIPCELNPDGPMTKGFVCLKCHKPGKESGNESQINNQRIFNVYRRFPLKKRELGRGRSRGRR
jgi:hypothetical protein